MHYTSIDDFPIFNWFKCIDLKDYTFTLLNRKECTDSELLACEAMFSELYSQYIDAFGISNHLLDIIDLQNEIMLLKIDMVLENDKSKQTFITLKELELKDKLAKKEEKTNTHKLAIEKQLGFRLNFKEVSVSEYYNYLNDLKDSNGRATDKE